MFVLAYQNDRGDEEDVGEKVSGLAEPRRIELKASSVGPHWD